MAAMLRREQPGTGVLEQQVLDTVQSLADELGGRAAPAPVRLDQSLDRDLGLGSLERIELLIRLEHRLGVRLSDEAMVGAETPGDLVAALLVSSPAAPERPAPPLLPVDSAVAAPVSAGTLVEVLRWHAEAHPERTHVFLRREDGTEQAISYAALLSRAQAMASGLLLGGVESGDRVALMLRTEEAFFSCFLGTLLAGGIPVPLYPPHRADRIHEYGHRQTGILRNCEARLLVTFREAQGLAALLRPRLPALTGVITPDQLALAAPGPSGVHPRPADLALIQYTSGSTGDPKGVVLSHGNLLANIRAIGEALDLRPDDVGVSWLPLYHDMGLIGAWLGSLYYGIPVAILSPLAFLARPSRWLWALHAHRGTVSPAPNFAFDLCVRKISDAEIEGLDLSGWRLALNGSEAVSPETIERFTRRFARYGFRQEAMCPVYGLAEASVGLTTPRPGHPVRLDRVSRETFERCRRAEPALAGDASTLTFVSCGVPLPGHDLRIVDDRGRPLPERGEGRIHLRGPSVTSGYWGNPDATRAVLVEGWLDSGDLGYIADGELFVTGRRKDLIIKAGRNLSPQEIEELVGDIPGVRKGCVAAFGLPDPEAGTERLVVVAESREASPEGRQRIRAAVLERLVAAIGLPPDIVVIAEPGSVPKTPSGKIRRSAMRSIYVAGTLGRPRPSARRQRLALVREAGQAWVARLPGRLAALGFGARVGAVALVSMALLWALVAVVPRGRPVDRLARLCCRVMLALAGCRLNASGTERLEASAPAVVVANHASYLDAVALLAALPPSFAFAFVAKRELLGAPVVGTVIARAGHLVVERADLSQSVADADRATAALRAGTSLLFFPEGTFVRAPGLLPFKLGAFKAAVETGRPVIPVGIVGTRHVFPADAWIPRRGAVTVTVGTAIWPRAGGWPEMVRLRDEARRAVAAASGEVVRGEPAIPS